MNTIKNNTNDNKTSLDSLVSKINNLSTEIGNIKSTVNTVNNTTTNIVNSGNGSNGYKYLSHMTYNGGKKASINTGPYTPKLISIEPGDILFTINGSGTLYSLNRYGVGDRGSSLGTLSTRYKIYFGNSTQYIEDKELFNNVTSFDASSNVPSDVRYFYTMNPISFSSGIKIISTSKMQIAETYSCGLYLHN